jgi:uncharacterized membrane protein
VLSFILWYLAATFLGWLAFPIAYRLFPGLADRGYSFSRSLGLLLWGYVFWLLASFGMLRNDIGGLLFAALLLAGACVWALRGIPKAEFLGWLRRRSSMLVTVEVLFLLAFATWTVVRATNPEALGTEKPMELAFINAIMHSPTFPPHDPWLSGYAISYYYFGYVMMAMLAQLTSVAGSIAFNLGIALIFALSAIGAYGLVYDLLVARFPPQPIAPGQSGPVRKRNFALPALLGPLFLLIVSNLEGFLEMLHTRGLLWQTSAAGTLDSPFWRWLDIKELNVAPQLPLSWEPTRFWWWWRASRVVEDYDMVGGVREIIDEFPFFSYLLADLHPHVLAMPFALLIMGLALHLFLNAPPTRWDLRINFRTLGWAALLGIPASAFLLFFGARLERFSLLGLGLLVLFASAFLLLKLREPMTENGLSLLQRSDLGVVSLDLPQPLGPAGFLLAAVALGGMAFLNTWDFPLYVALTAGAFALRQMIRLKQTFGQAARDFIMFGLMLGVTGGLLYIPFYLGFSSQAGGILPNLIYPTRGAQFWVMFAPLLVPILVFLINLQRQLGTRSTFWQGFRIALGGMLFLWIAALLLGLLILFVPVASSFFISSLGGGDAGGIFAEAILRRFTSPGGWLTMLVLLSLSLGLLLRFSQRRPASNPAQPAAEPEKEAENSAKIEPSRRAATIVSSSADIFALLLILFGTLLVTAPEFFFLRDLFGWRMNTIFKFYFQTWIIWSIAAAYASIVLLSTLRRLPLAAFSIGLVLLVGASLIYPIFSLPTKTNGFKPAEWSLDSTAYLAHNTPDDMAAIAWLQHAPSGVVAEAVPPGGGSYTEFGRVSQLSGLPAVLGWVGHENQWRGVDISGNAAPGTRQSDLERLYCSRDWSEAQGILDFYHIRYVMIGGLERQTYSPNDAGCPAGLQETKFQRNLNPVFKEGGVVIYEYSSENP